MKAKKTIPFPSDFQKKGSTPEQIAEFHLGHMGRMVGGSKSIYRYDNPDHYVIFNANILTKNNGKVWYGDLDITLDLETLRELAKDLGQNIFIFYESDARFGKEENPDYAEAAVEIHGHDGRTLLRQSDYVYFSKKDGSVRVKTDEEIEKDAPARVPTLHDENDYDAVELPDLKTIKVTKKEDPLSQFQKYFIEKYGKEKAVEIYRRMYVTKSYNDGLEKLATKYCKKQYPGLHPVKVEQSVAMYMLDMSPMNFQDEQPWEKPNTGYVRKDEDSSSSSQ